MAGPSRGPRWRWRSRCGVTTWCCAPTAPAACLKRTQLELEEAGIKVREDRVAAARGLRWEFAAGDLCHGRCRFLGSALFFCGGQHQRSELAASLGARFNEKGAVETGSCEVTNVPGLYVAGDASKEAQFVVVAAAEGTEAGMAINKALLKEDLAQKRNSTPSRIKRGGPYAKSG